MGKRIPKSRKHKKLKFVDPCYSGDGPRSKKNKLLPNEPPKKEDYQEVPKHATEIINLKNQVKSNKLKKRKKKKKVMQDDFIVVRKTKHEGDTEGSTRAIKNLPDVVKQMKNESEVRFLNRLQRMADTAIAEAKVEEKYGIELVNIDKSGNAEYVTAPKEVSEKKIEKRKKYREKEVEKKRIKMDESTFDLQKEKIHFGEVAMAPPVFTSKPRKAPETDKPGKKQLFLKKFLEPNKTIDAKNPKPLSTKWKDMPAEKRRLAEIERLRAVQMYRMLKNKKLNT